MVNLEDIVIKGVYIGLIAISVGIGAGVATLPSHIKETYGYVNLGTYILTGIAVGGCVLVAGLSGYAMLYAESSTNNKENTENIEKSTNNKENK